MGKGYYGTYNPKADRGKMSYGQKLTEDKIVLLRIFALFLRLRTSWA